MKEYIPWVDAAFWSANILLGDRGKYYSFTSRFNNRNDSFALTIAYEGNVLMEGIKLVLNVDVMSCISSIFKPECRLIPISENEEIKRITYENMVSGEVKLYHFLNFEA